MLIIFNIILFFKPLYYVLHIVFGGNDCRISRKLSKTATFVVVYPLFEDILRKYCVLTKSLKGLDNTELGLAANQIPHVVYLKYIELSKFRLFKWIYQNNNSKLDIAYSDFVMPQYLRELQKEYIRDAQHVKSTVYVLDSQLFNYFMNDILYFYHIHLITKQDI